MNFSDKLKLTRKQKNITQEQLAEILDVSRQAVSKWESGSGYPETEKLLMISKELNVSLDYLLLDENLLEKESNSRVKDSIMVPTGKISIRSYTGKDIVMCHKVTTARIAFAGKNEPKFVLNGVDKVTFWGENTTTLGWYASEDDIKMEIAAITQAIKEGIPTYEIKYSSEVEIKFLGIKLRDK